MLGEAIRLIPYALLAALSPLGFAATITVMKTGRVTALGFALGVLLGQLLACAILVFVGGASIPSRDRNHPTFQGLLGCGLALRFFGLQRSFAIVPRARCMLPVEAGDPRRYSNGSPTFARSQHWPPA